MKPTPLIADLGAIHVTMAAARCLREEGIELDHLLLRYQHGDWDEDEPTTVESVFAARHGLRVAVHYRLGEGETLRIESSADRKETCVMLGRERQVVEVGLREGYDRWAERYDREPNALILVEQPIVDGWVEALPGPPGHALDAATGTGRHALRLAERGWRVTAFDASPGMLEIARGRLLEVDPRAHLLESTLEDPGSIPAGAFDLVVCGLALSHVEELDAALRGLFNATRPGGTIILTDFHPEAYAIGWRTDCHVLGTRYLLPHVARSRAEYLGAVEESGMRIEEVRDIPLSEAPPDRLSPAGRAAVGAQPLCLAIRARRVG